MNKIKQIFANIPKHVQWLMLGAAILIVALVLVLVISGGHKKKVATPTAPVVDAVLSVDPASLEWTDIRPGGMMETDVKITPNVQVKVTSVTFSKTISGLTYRAPCINMGQIPAGTMCAITVTWTPDADLMPTRLTLDVVYRAADAPENMVKTESVPITLSARTPVVAAPAPPTPTPPAPTPKPYDPFEDITGNSDDDYYNFQPKPLPDLPPPPPVPAPPPAPVLPPAPAPDVNCFEFAFPGYDLSGNQFGWIRPMGGAYKFHPFSDTTCSNPTGIYNPDTGIITAIDDNTKKIGTDAEHIGFRSPTGGLGMPQLGEAPPLPGATGARGAAATSAVAATSVPAEGVIKRFLQTDTATASAPHREMILPIFFEA